MTNIQKHKRSGMQDYLLARGSTLAFLGFLTAGLALGSSFCVSGAEGAELLRSIVANQLSLQQQQNFVELVLGGAYGFVGILIFIYICVNCRKGSMLIYFVPLLYGISVGTTMAAVLLANGFAAFSYLLFGVFLPKAVQTMLLLSACNKTVRYCKAQYGGTGNRKGQESFPILLYLALFGLYFVIEAAFIYLFRGLL